MWLLLQLLLLLLCYNQHVAEGSSRSVESAYDSNKGVFSPHGRLVQLDYVEVIRAMHTVRMTERYMRLLMQRAEQAGGI